MLTCLPSCDIIFSVVLNGGSMMTFSNADMEFPVRCNNSKCGEYYFPSKGPTCSCMEERLKEDDEYENRLLDEEFHQVSDEEAADESEYTYLNEDFDEDLENAIELSQLEARRRKDETCKVCLNAEHACECDFFGHTIFRKM